MGALILLFAATLSVIMLASYQEIRQKNIKMLERYVNQYSLEERKPDVLRSVFRSAGQKAYGPGSQPGKPQPDMGPDYKLSTFYSVAMSDDGTVLAVDSAEKDIYSEEDLIGLAGKILKNGGASGTDDRLTYLVAHRPGYTLVAFIDNTVTESGLNTLLNNFLIVGCAAIVALFFISLIISNMIIHPLEENDRRQKQFISDASHELKTPVAVISANAEMLSTEIGENEWLSNILYEDERMGRLLKQLLDLLRTENAILPTEPVDFSRVVTGETLAFETLAFDNGITIRSDIDEGIVIQGSRTQLAQLVSVLLDNAIQHTKGKEIELYLKRREHHALLNVVNEGPEIPREKQEHLFDRFYRVDEARNSDDRHYGLGLSIAKAVADRHGGSISVSCRDGRVRFSVLIPVKK